jgi:hypothetical protein
VLRKKDRLRRIVAAIGDERYAGEKTTSRRFTPRAARANSSQNTQHDEIIAK